MERLDRVSVLSEKFLGEKSNPHIHMGVYAKRCCDHKLNGNCCHMGGVTHPWNTEPTIVPDKEEVTVATKIPTIELPTDLARLEELEKNIRARLLVVSEVRAKIVHNLKENQALLESLGGLL